MSLGRRVAAVASVWMAAGWLVGCTLPAQTDATAPGAGGATPSLRPLARQPAHPAGTAPQSQVATLHFDLFGPPARDDAPDDGVPGDSGSREVYQRGGASWYGLEFHNKKTANGERFDMGAMTAAHRSLPFGSRVCVRSLVNGKEVLVRINDRGPFAAGRIIDLSRAAAGAIDMLGVGIKQVALSLVDRDNARCAGAAATESDAVAAPPVEQRAAPPRQRTTPRRR
jgi:rare lipoprotein A